MKYDIVEVASLTPQDADRINALYRAAFADVLCITANNSEEPIHRDRTCNAGLHVALCRDNEHIVACSLFGEPNSAIRTVINQAIHIFHLPSLPASHAEGYKDAAFFIPYDALLAGLRATMCNAHLGDIVFLQPDNSITKNILDITHISKSDIFRTSTVVDPDFRRQGIARTLVERIEGHAKQMSSRVSATFCIDKPHSARDVNFRMGYVPLLCVEKYYPDKSDMVVVVKSLV